MSNTIQSVDEVIQIFDKDIKSSAQSSEDIKQEDIPEQTEEELIANAFTGDKIKELLSSKGPTVQAILLKPDGCIQQVLYDSTPSKNHVAEILGSPPTIIGQYIDLDVIIVGERYDVSPTEHALNIHKLRYPFNDSVIHGNIFMYRFNQNCEMKDFTLEEYNEFINKSDEDIGKVFKPLINDNNEPIIEQEDDINEDEQYQFMRNVILNKLREEFPKKFGREPTEEELENYVSATMAMFSGNIAEQDDDYDDEEYIPEEDDDMKEIIAADEEEDIINDEQLLQDKKDIEIVQNENKLPLSDINEIDEEKLINSQEFEKELREAIENVKHIASIDKEKILAMAKEAYMNDTGEQVPNDIIADAFKMFSNDMDEEEEEDNDEVIDQSCIDDALAHVKNLGKIHRGEFIEKISNTFEELNGVKPSENEINKILSNIQNAFLDETMDEFMETNGNNNDNDAESDEDYNPNDNEIEQIEEDKKIEVFEELEHGNSGDENDYDYDPNEENEIKQMEQDEKIDINKYVNDKVKVLVTPVKRRPSGSKMGVYLEECDEKKTLQFAEAKFEKINGRKPNDDDKERLKEFVKTGMLFESEINVGDNDIDEDYVPEKDEFDYSKDIEDDMEYEKEFEKEKCMDNQNENDDTSNKVEI